MAAIRIEGMDIPENCIECPLMVLNRQGERYCFITEIIAETDPFYGRPNWCPITEIE